MTKAGSPVSDETKEPGLLVRAASQPTSRGNRAKQSPADPERRHAVRCRASTVISARLNLRHDGMAHAYQTRSLHITLDNEPSNVLYPVLARQSQPLLSDTALFVQQAC